MAAVLASPAAHQAGREPGAQIASLNSMDCIGTGHAVYLDGSGHGLCLIEIFLCAREGDGVDALFQRDG